MSTVNLTINDKAVAVEAGSTILEAAEKLDIKIPTLCHFKMDAFHVEHRCGSCRICVVEVEKRPNLAPACCTPVMEGMVVHTNTLRAINARRAILDLLLSDHPKDCLTCPKNLNCELQMIAEELGIHNLQYKGEQSTYELDESSAAIRRDLDKCIMCRRCENACNNIQTVGVLSGVGRGFHAVVAPAAAWQFPGSVEQLFAAIRALGFDDVIEVARGAEMTTEHEAREFVERQKEGKGIMTTSCCPAWVNLVRKHLPAFLPHVSDTPSPMAYAARIAKERRPDNRVVFVGPCIAKRDEALRRENVDFVLSFEELGAVFAARKIAPVALEPAKLDRPAREDARNYAKSCGVTASVLEGLKGELPPDFKLDSRFIDGLDRKSVAMIRLYAAGKLPGNFLEVMSCKGGCVGGPCSLHS